MIDLVISNALVVAEDGAFNGWIAISTGRIVSLGMGDPPLAERTIDGGGHVLLPGRIDPHIHLGVHQDFEEDLSTTSAAALAGGTTVIMPHMRSLHSYHSLYPEWEASVNRSSWCDLLVHLQIQHQQHIEEIRSYHEQYGIRCYKVHLDYRRKVGPLDIAPLDDGDLYLTMTEVASVRGIVAVHCENVEIIRLLLTPAREQAGDLQVWVGALPGFCETADIRSTAFLSEVTGCETLIVHLSDADGTRVTAPAGNQPLRFETLAHLLTMTVEEASSRAGVLAKLNPPIRDAKNRDQLWQSIMAGTITTVASDHVSSTKHPNDDFWEAPDSTPGVELALPLVLTEGMRRKVPIETLARVLSLNAARQFQIDDRKGSIAVGKDADVTLVDLEAERTVSPQSTFLGVHTAADGMALRGWPIKTLLRGAIVYENGGLVGDPSGKIVRPTDTPH